MKFKKVFRGYDPAEVDKHLSETAAKEQQIRTAQKERIDELLEENRVLRVRVEQYKADEQAISQSLIAAQNMAQELKLEADKYSKLVLNRAKLFAASWRAYAKTLVASLNAEEVEQFNSLQRKIEKLINAYEGKDAKEGKEAREVAASEAAAAPSNAAAGFANPITKVESAAEQVIDLKELTSPIQSLEEICIELGIVQKESQT